MLRLSISSQPLRLEYAIQNAQLDRKTTPPQIQLRSNPAILEISQPRGELTIDFTAYYAALNRRSTLDFARYNADLGKQSALEAIARIVSEGNQMAQIETPANAIAEIAYSSSYSVEGELNWVPLPAPEIRYQANPAQINVNRGSVDLQYQAGTVGGDYRPGSVAYQVAQYPSLDVRAVDITV